MTALELPLGVLDRARAALLRAVFSFAILRTWLGPRENRVKLRYAFVLVTTLACLRLQPELMYVVAPLALGVPHLVSELRHLILGRELSVSIRWLTTLTALSTACALVLVPGEGGRTLAFAFGVSGIATAALLWKTRRGACLALVVLATAAIPGARDFVILSHGVVSLALWLFVFQKPRLGFIAFVTTFTLGATAFVVLSSRDAWFHASLLFSSIHYAVWLCMVPADAAKSGNSFRMRARSFVRALGKITLAAAIVAWLAALAGALVDPHRARDLYLRLAEFHVYVEALLFVYLSRRS